MLATCALLTLKQSQKGIQEVATHPRGISLRRAAAIWVWRVGV